MAFEDGSKAGLKIFPLTRTTLASLESLSLPTVQEIVISADMQCEKCRKRVADIITKMNAETESVEVNVLEKKVVLTFRLPTIGKVISQPLPKVAIIKRIFRSSQS
ncbi:uncharacterized protein LOC109797955 isoform X1 [Cajanus cajan]|uniref:uncharacterized protein LOC109797955 isoform X1 n=1 Tax=Cajanus cajan TaxID=3821 RepID=UPI00098DC1C6|nr:uncharacterized protein LOC109797955 isoform X1 [Cajanus cajan]